MVHEAYEKAAAEQQVQIEVGPLMAPVMATDGACDGH